MTDQDPFYRGTDFWMLNDRLSEEEIELQLTEMKKQGVYSFIARTYVGIISDYPGPEFKTKLKKIIETAKKLQMKVFLQAGYMPEHVPNLTEGHRLRYIAIDADTENAVCIYNGHIFSPAFSQSFLDIFSEDTVAFYLKTCYEDMWQEFSHEYGKTILSIWVDEPSYSGNFLPYPYGIEGLFQTRWGYPLENNLFKLFFDVDDYETVRYHYRKLLQDLLEQNYFRQLNAWCRKNNLLSSGHLMMEDTLRSQIARAGACMPYYPYLDIPGIDILGAQMNWAENPIKPTGNDTGTPSVPKNIPPQYITTPIQCCSVSRQLGTQHTLCEMYGVISQDMTFRNQRHLFDFMAVHGINHRCVHGIFYSLRGRRKRAYPPQIHYYQPYWDDLNKIYTYVSNVSQFISQGESEADALVIHPLASAYCEYTNSESAKICGVQPSDTALEQRDRRFLKLLTDLSFANVRFDLGDERILELHGNVQDDILSVGKVRYKTVILPDLKTIQSSTFHLLDRFIKSGGKVIILGNAPYMIDGFRKTVFDHTAPLLFVPNGDLPAITGLVKNQDYTVSCTDSPGILVRRKTEGNKSYYFLFNADCSESKDVRLHIPDTVSASLYDGFTGAITPCPCSHGQNSTEIKLTIAPGGSTMLITEKCSAIQSIPARKQQRILCQLENRWKYTCSNPNVLLLEFCRYKKDGEAFSAEYPTLAVQDILTQEKYEGGLSLSYTFTSDGEYDLMLALENAAEQAICFNGEIVDMTPCGHYLSRDFTKIHLPKCKKGENLIGITRRFSPVKKAASVIGALFTTEDGTELENLYLLGDFSVKAIREFETNGNLRFHKHMTITQRSNTLSQEIIESGYPFYAGSIELTQDFKIAETSSVFLEADYFCGAIANVYVNDRYCGDLHCAPYRLDISNALNEGENRLKIVVRNTLRNLFGPHHRPQGEEGNLFLGGYGNAGGSWKGNAKFDPQWFDHRDPDTPFWTDSYMLVRFGINNVKLITEEKTND